MAWSSVSQYCAQALVEGGRVARLQAMCGRYSITTPPEAMQQLFGFEGPTPNWPPRYNIAPTQPVPVVRASDDRSARVLELMRWGLVPSWSKEIPKTVLINARAETVAEKPSFRTAFRRRRALMPADGFYEWLRPESGPKQPFNIRRADGQPFAMAAVWEAWMDAEGSEISSVAILTTEANAVLAPIHHRMPVILEASDWPRWLDCRDETDLEAPLSLCRPAPDDVLTATAISARVNAVKNDDPGLWEPVDPAETAPSKKPENQSPPKQGSLF